MAALTCTNTVTTRTSEKGTPKRGYACSDCLDYRSQVEISPDGRTYTEQPCHCVTDTVQEDSR